MGGSLISSGPWRVWRCMRATGEITSAQPQKVYNNFRPANLNLTCLQYAGNYRGVL
jgi:hypothetical protein